jgi:hypothetical protein
LTLRLFNWLLLVLIAPFLQSCSTQYSLLPRVVDALQDRSIAPGDDSHIPLNPNLAYRYLKVDIEGRASALMVLAFEDTSPSGSVEVWYSASGQMIKTQNSRVIATSGLETNWSQVQYQPAIPSWVVNKDESFLYTRQRDEMPGYRFGFTEQLKLVALDKAPDIRFTKTLPRSQAASYQWFKETRVESAARLPASWFAWGMHRGQATIVYSEQCLAPLYCLKLQRWPVQESAL